MKKHTLVDLFAGCGGLSLGLEDAGFESVYVNDGYWSLVITSLIMANTLRKSIKNNVYVRGHLT